MCGFVGFTSQLPKEQRTKTIHAMMQRIVHRGPDMGSAYEGEGITLGFRRLSIIDLREVGNQPMFNEDGTVCVVFNGEIYNFQELRDDLTAKGHVFKSGADSEVLVHGYEEYGKDIVPKLRGMFAFVLWNANTGKLLAARDYFGIKPFYYTTLADGSLLFGSEIKAFLEHPGFVKEVDPDALRPYLSFQYAAGNTTFFKGVYCLEQGHMFEYTPGSGGAVQPECWWDACFDPDNTKSFDEVADEIDATVRESVKAHQISDVPVGSFLSGGVDSSYITACLMPENTFSVGFADENFDESNYAEDLSRRLGVKNFRKLLSADECFEAFSDIQYHMDQPQSNPSSVPLWFLAKLAREQVTVVLSGEGADELFAGYELYAATPAMEGYMKRVPAGVRKTLGKAAAALPAFKGRNFLMKSAGMPENWYIGQANVFPEAEALEVLLPAWRGGPSPRGMAAPYFASATDNTEVHKKQYVDLHLWMPGDILLRADKMCMAHSLELRVPFLDINVMELAEKVPSEYCIEGTQNKKVFRAAANKTLPDEWATRPKKGFPVPIRNWLREDKYAGIVSGYFHAPYAADFFDVAKLDKLLADHRDGAANHGRKMWTVFTFLVWYERFFVNWQPLEEAQINEVQTNG